MKNKESIYGKTCIFLMIDQIIKLWIHHKIKLNQKIEIIPKFFSLFYVKNTGAAFSILEDNTLLIIIISCIFLVLLNIYIKKEQKFTRLSSLSLGMIMGGIYGNLMDRIIYHGVIDYLSFSWQRYSFPIFNVADILITGGVIILFLDSMIEIKKEKKNKIEEEII